VIQVLKKSIFILLFGFLLSKEGSVTGIIMDENKKIIEGADVYFQDLSLGSNSDSEGKFLIRNLPLGENSLTISMIGYEKVEKNIVLYDENLQIGELYLKRDTLSIKEIKWNQLALPPILILLAMNTIKI
jgi:iron complex outermembrane receptor protein